MEANDKDSRVTPISDANEIEEEGKGSWFIGVKHDKIKVWLKGELDTILNIKDQQIIEYNKDMTRLHSKLDKEKQRELWEKIQSGDSSARNEVIYSCLPMVVDIAKKYNRPNNNIYLRYDRGRLGVET